MNKNDMGSILDENNEIDIKYLADNLDDEQCEAVMAETGKEIIVHAGAGTGKTRVLTHRVAYLILKKVPEESIMLLTFTNKASREMVERVKKLLNKDEIDILGGTFHSVGAYFLRRYAKFIGYKNNFTIITPDDAKILIDEIRKKYLKENGIKKSEFPESKIIYSIHSSGINLGKTCYEINESGQNFSKSIMEGVEIIIDLYLERKVESNAMDFDDLITKFRAILRLDSVREQVNKKYKYIMVDEYQDINYIQNEIIKLLNKVSHNLYAVGDPNQSIYSWRGSNVSYINNFIKQYPLSEKFFITNNYRSDGNILKLAENSINNNYWASDEKTRITAFLPSVNKPIIYKAPDDIVQADYIVRKIMEQNRNGIPFSEMAVLVRTNFVTRIIEKVFRQRGIPYKMLAGTSFFDRKQVRDLLAFLKFIENPNDESAFIRMCKVFKGVGEKTIENMFLYFKASGYSIETFVNVDELIKLAKIKKGAIDGTRKITSIIAKIFESKNNLAEVINIIMKDYYIEYLKRTEEDYRDRISDLTYLMESAKSYDNLTDFLNDMILDKNEQVDDEESNDKVVITTLHKSKGLEWDCVFMPYLNDGIFPSAKSTTAIEVEEERRVFYVGITRARKYLDITYVKFLTLSMKNLCPSIFLDEIEDELYK